MYKRYGILVGVMYMVLSVFMTGCEDETLSTEGAASQDWSGLYTASSAFFGVDTVNMVQHYSSDAPSSMTGLDNQGDTWTGKVYRTTSGTGWDIIEMSGRNYAYGLEFRVVGQIGIVVGTLTQQIVGTYHMPPYTPVTIVLSFN